MGTTKKSADFVKHIMEIIKCSEGFGRHLEKVRINGGGEGKCMAEFVVEQEHLNLAGGLHGGFTATLIDMITTYALMSKPCHPGVSVNLSVNYLQVAKEGDNVLIDAHVLKAGKKLAFLECKLRHKKDDSLIATGSHMKFVDIKNQ